MNIVVVGAGQVGTAVAKGLQEANQVSVIDKNPDRLGDLRGEADVLTLEGDGVDIDNLRDAKVEEADIVVASTNDDRTNILVCATIEALNPDAFSIARVTNSDYLRSWRHSRKAFNVDFMVASDYLTANRMVHLGFEQRARDVEYFGRGDIQMAEFDIAPDSPLAGKTIKDADTYEGLRYVAVAKDDTIEVVHGGTVISPDSSLIVIGRKEAVSDFGRKSAIAAQSSVDTVYILGGSGVGREIAELLEKRDFDSTLVEPEQKPAREIAEQYSNCFVLNNELTDPAFLESENIDEADLILTATRNDQTNLFASLLLQQLGAERVISVVHNSQYPSLFEHYGVRATVNPREEVIEEIFRYTRGRELQRVAFVEKHRGEVIEVTLDADSMLVGRPLSETGPELPDAMVIGALYRDGHVIIPRGNTVPGSGDEIVIFAETDAVDEVLASI